MPEQLLNSLFGMPSTKELPATGILKTGNNSLQSNQSNQGENSFLAKLAYSMNNASTTDDKNHTLIPSEQNNTSSIEGINHLIDMASMGAPTNIATNIHGDQTPLYQVLGHDIPVEAFTNATVNNNTNNGKAPTVQTQANTFPGHALQDNQGSSAFNGPNINLTRIAQEIARGSHPGLPSTSFTDTDKLNTSQASTKTNEQNVTGILNKLNPVKIADTAGKEPLSQSSTIPDKQIAESQKGSNTNSLNVQVDTNKNFSQGQTPAPSVNNFDSNQNNQINTKINEQNAAGILNKLNPVKIADTTGKEPLSQSSTIPDKQIAESQKGSNTNSLNVQVDTNKNFSQGQTPAPSVNNFDSNQNNAKINNQNAANNANKLDSAPTTEKTSTDPILQASGTSNNKIINPDTLLNPKDGANNKAHEQLKEQYSGNTLPANSGANPLSQHSSTTVQTNSNESQKIFDIQPDSAGATASKSQDNTNSIINSGVNSINADEVLLPLNTSSNNSSFNSQGADTPNESYINAVTTSQKVEPGKDFTSTLSQINNSTKLFESLGSDTADNIVQKAKLFMEGGRSEVKIQLNPPELGILKLEFEVEDDNLELKIKVERSAVKDVIEKDIPRLRELLSNSDVDVGKLDVSLQEEEDERLSLMDKDLQSDSENDSTEELPDHDNEFLEDGTDEESIEYDEDSNKINFLV